MDMKMKNFVGEMENYLRSVPYVPFGITKGGGKCDGCGSVSLDEIFFDFADSEEILALYGIGRENFALPPDEEGDIYVQKSLCLSCFKKWFDDKPKTWNVDYDYRWLKKIIAESDADIEMIKTICRALKTRFYFVDENLYICGCGFVSGTGYSEEADYWDIRDGLIDIHNEHLQECPLLTQ